MDWYNMAQANIQQNKKYVSKTFRTSTWVSEIPGGVAAALEIVKEVGEVMWLNDEKTKYQRITRASINPVGAMELEIEIRELVEK